TGLDASGSGYHITQTRPIQQRIRVPIAILSFNNTIVTVTHVQGWVISWSSVSTCGFEGTRRGTQFVAQTAATNVILTIADQGMQWAEVMIKGIGLERDASIRDIHKSGILLKFIQDVTPCHIMDCVESRVDSKCLYYSRFILSPHMKGQADTICITHAKSRENVLHMQNLRK
ncbi:hypothetical protein Lal_00015160, partial [Lupinus albus]